MRVQSATLLIDEEISLKPVGRSPKKGWWSPLCIARLLASVRNQESRLGGLESTTATATAVAPALSVISGEHPVAITLGGLSGPSLTGSRWPSCLVRRGDDVGAGAI